MDNLEKLKKITGESDTDLLSLYLSLAEEKILEYTNRKRMLDEFMSTQFDLALAMYERGGMSAEKSHTEGGITSSFLEYSEILKSLNNRRLAKAGGVYHEKNENESVPNLSE